MSRSHIPQWMRDAVVYYHGTRCLACGVETHLGDPGSPTRRHLDHVIPECEGGRTVVANLQILCRLCNQKKGPWTHDYRPVHWFKPLVHLDTSVGGCARVDTATLRRHATTRDPFAVTCGACKAMPKMLWFARELAAHLAAA